MKQKILLLVLILGWGAYIIYNSIKNQQEKEANEAVKEFYKNLNDGNFSSNKSEIQFEIMKLYSHNKINEIQRKKLAFTRDSIYKAK